MYIFFHLQKCNQRMSQQETFMDKYIFEGFSYQWPYNNMFVLSYLVQQNEEYMGKKESKKKKKEKRRRNWVRCLPCRNIPHFPN